MKFPIKNQRSLILLGCFLGVSLLNSQAGTVVGVVPIPKGVKSKRVPVEKYTGKISQKVAAPPVRVAGVWLAGASVKVPASPAPVTLDQTNYQFGKSLLIVPRNTKVFFPNNDPDYHNIYSLSRAKRFDIGRYKKSERPVPSVTFDRAGLVRLRCEIHEHMEAAVLVVDSSHTVATDGVGKFSLKNVPTGNYILHAFLNEKVRWQVPVKVRSGKVTKVNFPRK